MNKKLIAIVAGASLALPMAASADVSVYGAAQVEIASFDRDQASVTGSEVTDGIDLVDNARGRFGVKASEDLGNGLKGIANFEWKVDTVDNDSDSTSKASLTGRTALVGLTGGFGTFVMGNLKSPYKYAGGVKYDPFVATTLEARGNAGMSGKESGVSYAGHNGFVPDTIAYVTPKIAGGFVAQLAYGPSEDDGAIVTSFMYKQKNWEAFVATFDAGDRINLTQSYSTVKFGGQFKMGNHKISAQIENADDEVKGTEPTYAFVGYQGKFGSNTLVAQFGQRDDDTAADEGTSYASIGVIHKFSKTTRVFGGFRSTSPDAENTDETVISVGLRKDFK